MFFDSILSNMLICCFFLFYMPVNLMVFFVIWSVGWTKQGIMVGLFDIYWYFIENIVVVAAVVVVPNSIL